MRLSQNLLKLTKNVRVFRRNSNRVQYRDAEQKIGTNFKMVIGPSKIYEKTFN